MTRITIPQRLSELLGDSALADSVRLYVKKFDQWVSNHTTGLFFFPEYTDHGPQHMSSVLAGAEALIQEEAWPLLTPEDAGILIIATILHDSAMHLTADGLLDLLTIDSLIDRAVIKYLDDKTWPILFEDFFAEARRWDYRKLHTILGDKASTEPEVDLIDYIRHPKELSNPEIWSVRYRKFLGYFVRRHHARLAHEIIDYGVPGSSHGHLRPDNELASIADLAGLVARSHNLHLRETFDYLAEKYYGRVTCRNAHPVFLMAVLRIADYLQFRADRVNPTILRIQRLRSPLSSEEWAGHLAIHEVRPDEQDREAAFVVAKPESARTFLKLRSLLQGLQWELDTTWAVLGEVYSRQGDLCRLGLTLRRVRSNLDDPLFVRREKPLYFPIRAAFDAAGADLLKLLIKPLYGDRPDIGIRELLQNSIDAVLELRAYINISSPRNVPSTHQSEDVIISLEHDNRGDSWLAVTDKGIGMRAETIRDYFLKVGASYRQSEAWRRAFELEGSPNVLRSGRFGIGALAAFLLGNQIHVQTRHVDSHPDEGISFSASVSDDLVELKRVTMETVGTIIRIKISKEVAEYLKEDTDAWDWYTFKDPKVERILYGSPIPSLAPLPLLNGELPSDWNAFPHTDYESIAWTYSKPPGLVCNGIKITRPQKRADGSEENPFRPLSFAEVGLRPPLVSILDRAGKLPLTLRRDDLETRDLPFSTDLIHDIAADLCSFLLLNAPTSVFPFKYHSLSTIFGLHGANPYKAEQIDPLWYSPYGSGLVHPWNLHKATIRRALVIVLRDAPIPSHSWEIRPVDATLFLLFQGASYSFRKLFSGILGLVPVGGRVLLPPDTAVWSYGEPAIKLDYGWGIWNLGDGADGGNPGLLESLYDNQPRGFIAAAEWLLDPNTIEAPKDTLSTFFDRVMDVPVISYAEEKRKSHLPKAFVALRQRMATWRRSDLCGWRQELLRATITTGAA